MYVTNMHAALLEEDRAMTYNNRFENVNVSTLRMGYLNNYIKGSLTNMGIGRE